MQQPRGHAAHLVEEVEGWSGAAHVDRPGSYPQSGMDDPEVTMPTATLSPTAARCRW